MAKNDHRTPHSRINDRMEQAGHTVASFAEATGIAYNTLKRRLRHTDKLTLAELSAIAEALDTDVLTLIGETTRSPVPA